MGTNMTRNDWIVRATAKLNQLENLYHEVFQLKLDDVSLENEAEVIFDDAENFLRMICNRVTKYEYRIRRAREALSSNPESEGRDQ